MLLTGCATVLPIWERGREGHLKPTNFLFEQNLSATVVTVFLSVASSQKSGLPQVPRNGLLCGTSSMVTPGDDARSVTGMEARLSGENKRGKLQAEKMNRTRRVRGRGPENISIRGHKF